MAIESINLGTAPNDGTGDDLRSGGNKVNKNFEEVLTFTGGAQYIDDFYTASNPLVITSGNTAKLTCNNATVIDGNVPPEFSNGMWDPTINRLVAVNDKDRFITEIRFKAECSVNNGHFRIDLNIDGSLGVINSYTNVFAKSSGIVQLFKNDFILYSGSTFIQNGCEILITAENGDLEIFDIKILPTRIHKGY